MDSTCLGGRYEIVRQLGAGGFSRTFLVQDHHLPNHPCCVIKQLKPQTMEPKALEMARRLFDTEARVLYQLGRHPQIPTLLAHFEEHQEFYLAQEYIEGVRLSRELAKRKPWTETKTVLLLREILGILVFVHQQDVIHRDIKPSNLIRRYQDGKIVLIDFGAVKEVSAQRSNPDNELTSLTVAVGTQGYMPNEQLAGKPRFSSDVYAIGMIGIRALTGIHPKHLKDDIHTGELDWQQHVSDVSPDLAEVLDCMVRYDFRDRYPTAMEALDALQSIPIDAEEPSDFGPDALSHFKMLEETPSYMNHAIASSLPDDYPPPLDASDLTSIADFDQAELLHPLPVTPEPRPKRKARFVFVPAIAIVLLIAAVGTALSITRPNLLTSLDDRYQSQFGKPRLRANKQLQQVPALVEALIPAELRAAEVLAEAQQLQQKGEYEAALRAYTRAAQIQPDLAVAHLGRCETLNALSQPSEAIVACNDALAYDPDYPAAMRAKGYALEQQDRRLEALKLYERATLLDPELFIAWLDQGRVLQDVGRSAEAVRALERAIALDRNSAEAWNIKGQALWNLRRYNQAVEALDKALQIQPDHPAAQQLRKTAREVLGR